MSQTIPDLIVTWAPLLVFFTGYVYVTRSAGMRARGPSGHTMVEMYELQIDEMKRNAAALERIAQALEQRGS